MLGGRGGGSTCFYSACLFFIPYLCWQDVHDVKDNWKSQNRGCCGNRHLYFCRSLIYDSGNGNFDFALSVFVCIVLVILCIWMSDVWSRRGLQLQFCLVSEWESVDKFENVNIVVVFSTKVLPIWISEDSCIICATNSSKSASEQAGVTCRNTVRSCSFRKCTSANSAATGVSTFPNLNQTAGLKLLREM